MSRPDLSSSHEAIHLLKPSVKEYEWGSRTLLPNLAGKAADENPKAELWFGSHPAGPTLLQGGGTLDELTHLPYLVKLIAADKPLSIQAHPDIQQARKGFEAENAKGIPLDHPRRSFRDTNHKPEMLVALSEFTALVGFRAPEDSSVSFDLLSKIVSNIKLSKTLSAMARQLAEGELRQVFNRIVDPLGVFKQPNGWTRSILHGISASNVKDKHLLNAVEVAEHFPDDPGAIVTILMNLVHLSPGQAFFVPSRTIHAYCSGLALEVMATSDNVIRSGLTSKHINISKLDDILEYEATAVPYLQPIISRNNSVITRHFVPPTKEFMVRHYALSASSELVLQPDRPQIAVCAGGKGSVTSSRSSVDIAPTQGIYLTEHAGDITVSSNLNGLSMFLITQP